MMTKGSKIALGVVGALLLLVLITGSWLAGTYNSLIRLDQATQAQWAQVENVYQRRADLIPNLVNTVKGAAKFEQDTLTAVVEARSKVGQVSGAAIGNIANDPAAFARFQQAQDGLSSALSHLMVVMEKYPELKAVQGFSDLQVQLEQTENRISVERMRFNVAANDFNATRESFPTNIVASFFGSKFNDKAFFKATEGSARPPEVNFR
jgi:LemA protein